MKSIKAKILLAFILFLLIFPMVNAPPNEGYGEDSTSLGQSVDVFDTSNNVTVAVDVVHNSSLELMELNFTGSVITYENYSAYTKVGADSRLTVTDRNITTNPDYRRGTEEGYYLDQGAGNIGAFTYYFEFVISDVEAGDADSRDMGSIFGANNWVGDFQDRPVGTYDFILVNVRNDGANDDQYRIRLLGGQNGAIVTDQTSAAQAVSASIFYGTIWRDAGGDVNFTVHSDSDRTTQVLTLADTDGGQSDAVRYLYCWSAIDAANDANDYFVGSVADLTNQTNGAGYEASGYFLTSDYLANPNANGPALAALINSSIPANTGATVQFSDDNSTWVNAAGAAGAETVTSGFQAIDLRTLNYSSNFYFMFNLSTSDDTVTSRIDQVRLITTIGTSTTLIQNVTGEWVYYNLSAISTIVGTHDHGLVNDTYFVDSLFFNCSEVVGVPGYEVHFNITGIDTSAISVWFVNYVYYDGSASHIINVQLRNLTSGNWVTIGLIPDMTGFEWMNDTIYGLRIPNEFMNSSGAIVGRYYHASAGNVNHDISFDRISFLAFIPSDVAADEFQYFWIVLAIALILIFTMIAKMWFSGED